MVALAAGKTYLTAGGYVVEIINDELHSSERTAPGITRVGRNVLEINKDPTNTCKDGWYYEPNGAVNALTEEWTEKLRIVEELPFPIPELPEGYEWADGYPQFREIKKGEYYVSNSYHMNPSYKDFIIHPCKECSPATESKFAKKRFAVVRATAMPTTEPAKILDPLVEKYGEPEAGWRWLADEERVEKGDQYKSRNLGYFINSDNWRGPSDRQGSELKPYRRKIEIKTAPSKEYIEMHNYVDFPRYYKHRDDAFVENIKYIKRAGERERHTIKRDGSIENNGNIWCSNCDSYVAKGTWIEVPEAEVFTFIASKSKEPTDEKVTMKFPIYYNHKHGFNGHTKYVKRINENQYTVILEKDGKEAENEEYLWDKDRDRSVAEGTWIEVPEKEVLDFIASVTVTGANSMLVKKEEEIEMKKETAIAAGKTVAKFAGTWGFKAANYWLFEPAVNIVRPIMKGVRYITLVGALCAAGYGYNHPEMVKNAIKSCIPKITIEAPEVLKG